MTTGDREIDCLECSNYDLDTRDNSIMVYLLYTSYGLQGDG